MSAILNANDLRLKMSGDKYKPSDKELNDAVEALAQERMMSKPVQGGGKGKKQKTPTDWDFAGKTLDRTDNDAS